MPPVDKLGAARVTLRQIVGGVFISLLAGLLWAFPAVAVERVAFVVGINTYDSPNVESLRKAVNDAKAMRALLEENGFTVIEATDPDRAAFQRKQWDFLAKAVGAQVAL